ncbi:MAG: hypothetical protein N2485_08430, partial [bacterium]|nr:hypothetical protein [bacterium]
MIRILQIIDSLRRGGKERQLVELLKGINKKNFENYIVIFDKVVDGYDEDVKNILGSDKVVYLKRRFRWDFFIIFDLFKICKLKSINIIIAWEGMCSFYGLIVSKITKIKFINSSIRDTGLSKGYRFLIQKIVLNFSKNIISNSFKGLEAYKVLNKGKVIYNGLDFSRFINSRRKRNDDKFVIG